SVSTTVSRRRLTRRSRTRSRTSKASLLARWSCGPSPTRARMSSDDTTCSGRNCAAAQVDLPDAAGPARTTRHGAGSLTVAPPRHEVPRGRGDGLAGGETLGPLFGPDAPALFEDGRPALSVDGAVDDSAAHQRRVGGVDDGVDVLLGDVPPDQRELHPENPRMAASPPRRTPPWLDPSSSRQPARPSGSSRAASPACRARISAVSPSKRPSSVPASRAPTWDW